MKAVFVADPMSSLDPAIDTTMGLMAAALDCGAEVWTATARDLEVLDGRPYAQSRAGERFVLDEPCRIPLDDAVFIRTNPPP